MEDAECFTNRTDNDLDHLDHLDPTYVVMICRAGCV